jgi:hypothetical protein
MFQHFFKLIGLTAILLFAISCNTKKEKKHELLSSSLCDVEKVTNQILVGTNKSVFDGALYTTDIASFSGKKALEISPESKYGFGNNVTMQNKNYIVVSAWRKKCTSCGTIAIKTSNKELKDQYGYKVIEEKDGWEKIQAERIINLPKGGKVTMSSFYFNKDTNVAIVDDFEVRLYNFKKYPNYPELPQLVIDIKGKDFEKLTDYAAKGRSAGVLKSAYKKKVDGKLSIDGENYNISLRLKGDWTDHLEGDKWSYRIELSDDQTVLGGLKEFSIQNPETRHFTEEYFLHQLASNLDILNTRYGFFQLTINGRNLGLYAYEEHFTKQLIESQKRREGPLVKFDEEPFWDTMQLYKKTKSHVSLPFYPAAQVIPFDYKKTVKSESLSNQFSQANILMRQYKWAEQTGSEIFDAEKIGKYLALCDLGYVHHSYAWHNQRLYYNPVINKLEPILFDAYQPMWPEGLASQFRLTLEETRDTIKLAAHEYLVSVLLKDKNIFDNYLKTIAYFNTPSFQKTIKKLTDEAISMNAIMQKEFPTYSFNKDFFYNELAFINNNLVDFEHKIRNTYYRVKYDKLNYDNEITNNIGVVVFVDTISQSNLMIENYHGNDVRVEKIIFDKDTLTIGSHLAAYTSTNWNKQPLLVPITKKQASALKKVIYSIADKKKDYSAEIYSWPKRLTNKTILQQYKKTASLSLPHDLINDTVWIKPGMHVLKETMVVTEGKTLAISAGTNIDLVNGAKIICFGNVALSGTKKAPITIHTSDKTGQGLVVLQAPNTSNVTHVVFDGLNTSLDRYWTLTGAVTFYESDVVMNHVTVKNNTCEDALNVIRSYFDITNLEISGTFSDGFDADYCTGKLDSSIFTNTGNDCIDFSTSEITISNVTIKNSGDKGISGGEASTLKISNVTIDGAAIGIASKDRSGLTINNVSISNAKYGLAAFQKKPEYGPANINAAKIVLDHVENPFIIEKNSQIIWDGKIHVGTKKLDLDQLYVL